MCSGRVRGRERGGMEEGRKKGGAGREIRREGGRERGTVSERIDRERRRRDEGQARGGGRTWKDRIITFFITVRFCIL